MKVNDFDKAQGHWILARMGKRVLRPGGKELTLKLVKSLNISSTDDIVEFAPGMGFTASLTLKNNPNSYTAIDADEDVVKLMKEKFSGNNVTIFQRNASATSLLDNSKDKIYGEAMLTMHADHRKSEIVREAHRILKTGGLYAIHELGLTPENLNEEIKTEITKDFALTIKVNARPLTQNEWKELLEKEGFKLREIIFNPMHLLEIKRIIDDEGFLRALKIGFNILTHPKAKKRVLLMRKSFRKYQQYINAIAIVAEKL
ncbi:MAG: methyltransferase domain-containing protein [Ignavibacteriaceae bacterium]|nr:methyltransferase domain-containing protein [Ignavibacteriaceae bacterium]